MIGKGDGLCFKPLEENELQAEVKVVIRQINKTFENDRNRELHADLSFIFCFLWQHNVLQF